MIGSTAIISEPAHISSTDTTIEVLRPCLSASQPKKAEPRPPRPNISPKKIPATIPTLPGIRSVA